ncbi:TPA: hypothetical protein ACGVBW_001079 [Vibrio vulnificus]|nr:hypothetical protein [Vibrio parahaemolyticus]
MHVKRVAIRSMRRKPLYSALLAQCIGQWFALATSNTIPGRAQHFFYDFTNATFLNDGSDFAVLDY